MMAHKVIEARRIERVLVLEDQPFFSRLLAIVYATAGYKVEISDDGDALLSAAARSFPDLVVLDIDVPGNMDGLQVLERLRRRYGRERLPIMMASARSESRYAQRAQELGADLFLRKPYSIAQLLTRSEALLEPRRGQAEALI